ncbi:MAG TPA: DUF4433 domain-containing protein [Phycisphaerae bacterium]|nr:DUF4433 domain-containing protein [Phycisphaerae bacterium]
MVQVPANPKIFHITHVDNLAQILAAGGLLSDAKRMHLGLACELVGIPSIKQRRLDVLEVNCHPGTRVGEYVPFYFCPRSIMLYILHRANHPDLSYRGGQTPIVHLQADLMATIRWAEHFGRRWAFSDSNAGACLANFFKSVLDLDKVNWTAVEATDFRPMVIKEGKQAEFLVYESFPWTMVEKIGVISPHIEGCVNRVLRDVEHKPLVSVEPAWYY